MVTDQVDRVKAKAIAGVQHRMLNQGHVELAKEPAVVHQRIIDKPAKDLVTPLVPIKVLSPIGVKRLPLPIPQLQLGIAHPRRCPNGGAPDQ